MNDKNKHRFENQLICSPRYGTLKRIVIPETGDGIKSTDIGVDFDLIDTNYNIVQYYMNWHMSYSRDWYSTGCVEARCGTHSVSVYYGAEVQKMLHSKDRV